MPMILKQLWTRSTRIIIRRSCRTLALILKQQCLSKMMVQLMKISRWVQDYYNETQGSHRLEKYLNIQGCLKSP